MKKYIVINTFNSPFGDKIFVADNREDVESFCKMYKEECKELCKLQIVETEGTIRNHN